MKKISEFLKNIRGEALRYIFIGVCTTLINFAIFTIMCKGLQIDVTISNVTSVITSILFAYVANKIVVFRSHCRNLLGLILEFSKFVGARLFTMIIEVGGVFLLVNVIGQDSVVGKLETQVLVVAGNFFISKYLVFKAKPQE